MSGRQGKFHIWRWLAGLLILLPIQSHTPLQQRPEADFTSYLPVVANLDPIWLDVPIWTEAGGSASPQVGLFRRRFALDEPLIQAELHLFADTRYEAWLDGAELGRGPARFSKTLREYDLIPLGDLSSGEHLIAVLVQWAPNARRSESISPGLLGHIQGQREGKTVIVERTSPDWRSMASDAWNLGSAPVHSWDLIGPTELLDFSRLPGDWFLPGFLDQSWPYAEIQQDFSPDSPQVDYQPRSIERLAEFEIPVEVLDSGDLSPGFRFRGADGALREPHRHPD